MATAMLAKGERTTQGPNSFKNVAEYNSTADKDNLQSSMEGFSVQHRDKSPAYRDRLGIDYQKGGDQFEQSLGSQPPPDG